MANLKSFDEFNSSETPKTPVNKISESKESITPKSKKPDLYYWNMTDEKGKRYDIPLLSPKDNDYRDKYVSAMKLKEEDPETFARMLKWS